MRKLAMLFLLVGTPLPSFAQETDLSDEEEFLDEFAFLEDAAVVESAARHRQEIGMSPSAITVITREDIETSGATTIPHLLRIVPGMAVIYSAASTGTLGARLHYVEGNYHLLVLIDGREANLELLGQAVWENQPVSLEDVERIEIIRGPGSALYGANALAGVISITTRAITEETSGWAMAEVGELGSTRLGARASTRLGSWGLAMSGGLNLLGTFEDPHSESLRVWKLRALADHRITDSSRLLIGGALSAGRGPRHTNIGKLDLDAFQTTLRLEYDSEDLRGRLYWFYLSVDLGLNASLEYGGTRLADLKPALIEIHTVEGEVQWTLPELFDPLLIIIGGVGRVSWLGSDDLLDGRTYDDIKSSRYHLPGIKHWETRAGGFAHAEFAAAEWVTLTGGVRLDYNNLSGLFLSPRLAAVFRPGSGQFVRLGAARAFHKPSFLESSTHIDVTFPADSPITGPDQYEFREFMTRVIGNPDLNNEELLAFEVGYMGQFFDERLSVSLDLYYNLYSKRGDLTSRIVSDPQGLPDLDKSSFMYENMPRALDIIGSELSLRFTPARQVQLLASWIHKEVYRRSEDRWSVNDPRNFVTLGGRFRTGMGILGSLYLFVRSEYRDPWVNNPAGLLEQPLEHEVDTLLLIMGKLGWRFALQNQSEIEAGVKLFLPVSPSSADPFRSRDKGGGVTPNGIHYGAIELGRIVSAYLQGSF